MKRCLWFVLSLSVFGAVSACGSSRVLSTAADSLAATGLTGTVLRGPITPVCRVNVPCDAPFSASFDVRRDSVRVATFHSNADGTFTVALPPGTYLVVPASDAPLMNASMQAKTVTVGSVGLTEVHLLFDTGIR